MYQYKKIKQLNDLLLFTIGSHVVHSTGTEVR